MDNRERLNVYFEMEGNFYMLFQVVNIGTKNIPDFKFSGFSNLYINHKTDNNKEDDKGYLTEEEIEKSTIHSYIEFTYHKDGSFLTGKATLLCPLWPNRICSCWSQYD